MRSERKHSKKPQICLLLLFSVLAMFLSRQSGHADWFDKLGKVDHSLEIYKKVVEYVNANYVDPDIIDPKLMIIESFNMIQKSIPEVLSFVSDDGNSIRVRVYDKEKFFPIGEVKDVLEMTRVLSEGYSFIIEQLGTEIESKLDVEYAAIRGMLSTLDPHSVLLTPEIYKETQIQTTGKFGGLGIVISIRGGKLTVISPIEGTPAARAGLKPKDVIVKIEDESTINMSLTEAVNKMRGDPGTKIFISYMREGFNEPKAVTLTREIIQIPSIQAKLLKDNVIFVAIKNFQKQTTNDLKSAVTKLEKEAKGPIRGYILDLRNNPGGLLDQAVDVSNAFLKEGVIVTTVAARNKYREHERATQVGTFAPLPMTILINGGSASGSEIVAGALKNNNRGVVIGTTSFGKGTVQTIVKLGDETGLKLTIAKYLTPGNKSIQSVGIVPDIFLNPGRITKEGVDLFWQQNYIQEVDLKHHFNQAEMEHEEPAYRMTYLLERDESGDQETEYRGDKLADDLEEVDPEVRIAKKLILDADTTDRSKLLEKWKTAIEKIKEDEQVKISEKLAMMNIDWSKGINKPKNGLSFKVAFRFSEQLPLLAGNDAIVYLDVTNKGKESIYQFRALSKSDHYMFNNKDILFGKIDPGKTITAEVKAKIPKNMPTLLDEVKFEFYDQFESNFPSEKLLIKIRELPMPHLAYSFRFLDDRQKGDGLIQAGEDLEMKIRVQNDGPGKALDVVAFLVNESGRGLYISSGRVSLGEIGPGESKTGGFKLNVQGLYQESSIKFDIKVVDSTLGTFIQGTHAAEIHKAVLLKEKKGLIVPIKKSEVISLREGAQKKAKIAGTVNGDIVLPIVGESKEFYKVIGNNEAFFVEKSEFNLWKSAAKEKTANLKYTWETSPVILALTDDPYKIIDNDEVILKGRIKDDIAIRDVYIFCDEQKVYYKKGAETNVLEFDAKLPLKEGTNRVTLFARNMEKRVNNQTLYLFHQKTNVAAGEKKPQLESAVQSTIDQKSGKVQ